MRKKGQTEYAWIFSLIVGSLIIFLAIFAAQKFKGTAELQTQSEILRELDILLNPFSSVGSITTMTLSKTIDLPTPLQINFSCNTKENYNEINVRTKNGKEWGEWLKTGYRIKDKYVFSKLTEGKTIWVFSKPLEMPWRIDDLIYITNKNYCFDNPPEQVKREVESLKNNALFTKDKETCPPESIEVCFTERNCDININYDLGILRKEGKTLQFTNDALMYAALLSEPQTYQCNTERLSNRLGTQVNINIEKATLLKDKGCKTDIILSDLQNMKQTLEEGTKISKTLQTYAEQTSNNNPRECPVF